MDAFCDGMITVRLPTALTRLFPGAESVVTVSASTVEQMIRELDARWPGMHDRLCDSRPSIRRHINVFVDGDRAELGTPLRPNAEVYVLTAISGG